MLLRLSTRRTPCVQPPLPMQTRPDHAALRGPSIAVLPRGRELCRSRRGRHCRQCSGPADPRRQVQRPAQMCANRSRRGCGRVNPGADAALLTHLRDFVVEAEVRRQQRQLRVVREQPRRVQPIRRLQSGAPQGYARVPSGVPYPPPVRLRICGYCRRLRQDSAGLSRARLQGRFTRGGTAGRTSCTAELNASKSAGSSSHVSLAARAFASAHSSSAVRSARFSSSSRSCTHHRCIAVLHAVRRPSHPTCCALSCMLHATCCTLRCNDATLQVMSSV